MENKTTHKQLIEFVENNLRKISVKFAEVDVMFSNLHNSNPIVVDNSIIYSNIEKIKVFIKQKPVFTAILKNKEFIESPLYEQIEILNDYNSTDGVCTRHFSIVNPSIKQKVVVKEDKTHLWEELKQQHNLRKGSVVEYIGYFSKQVYGDYIDMMSHKFGKIIDIRKQGSMLLIKVGSKEFNEEIFPNSVNVFKANDYKLRNTIFLNNNENEIAIGSKFVFKSNPNTEFEVYQKIETLHKPTVYQYLSNAGNILKFNPDDVWFFE